MNDDHFPKFTVAFQPIYDALNEQVTSYETLLRGFSNEAPGSIFSQINQDKIYAFDELIRKKGITLATSLGVGCNLNLNFFPGSIIETDSALSSVVEIAKKFDFPLDHITIEITETEVISDLALFNEKLNKFRSLGLEVAIDDFGAGCAGLNLLAEFQPDKVKIDMSIIQSIHVSGPRQAICRGILTTCNDLGIDVVAEGVESKEDYDWCCNEGIFLFQGFYVAKPGLEFFPLPFAQIQSPDTP